MLIDPEVVVAQIARAFAETPYPGDGWLQGSREGCEPYDEVSPFQGQTCWQAVDPALLDAHAAALSFFSEAGFRFFLPAFLVADLRGQLTYADPLFHITHGFFDFSINIEKPQRTFVITSGKSQLINPRRYGAMTAFDHACYRLSVFTREEAAAIVAYLEYKRATDAEQWDTERIDAALDLFWRKRAHAAPAAASLHHHLQEEAAYLGAIRAEDDAGREGG